MKKWLYMLTCAHLAIGAYAQNPQLKASADRGVVGLGDVINLSFTLNASEARFVPPLNLEEDFYVMSGPFKSSSVSIINGQRSAEIVWSFRVQPREVGNITLLPALVEWEGQTIESNEIEIRVTEQSERSNRSNDPRAYAAEQTFFRVLPSKLRVYEGEPFGVEYRLYGYVVPGQPEIMEIPEYEGFFTEILESDRTKKTETSDDGRELYSWNWAGVSLTPQRPGYFEFDELITRIPTPVPTRRRNIFGQMVATNVYVDNIDRAYHPDIEVLPLPQEGKPDDFSGGVGSLKFSVELSREEVEVNQSVTLKLTLSGRGNLNTLQMPDVALPDQLELFEPEDERTVIPSITGLSGSITREYIIVPRYRGTYKIPSISFSYFDPNQEAYVTVQTEEKQITVTGDAPITAVGEYYPESPQPEYPEGEEVEYLNKEIRWIHPEAEGFETALPFYSRLWFWGGTGVSLFVSALVLTAGRIKNWNEGRFTALSKAGRTALGQLKNSENAAQLENALSLFIANGFEVDRSHQVSGVLEKHLVQNGVKEEDAKMAYNLLVQCEEAQFGAGQESHSALRSRIETWIKSMMK